MDSLNDEQKLAIIELGFGELMKMNKFDLPYELISWLVNRFDIKGRCLKVHNREVRVIEKDVKVTLDIKKGNIDIAKCLVKGEMDKALENELNVIVRRRMIPLVLLKESLLSMKSARKEFKVKFTMYVIGKFLNVTMN